MKSRSSLFDELKRRNVIRIAITYAVSAWLLAQLARLAVNNFAAPDWTMNALLIALAVGFPFALFKSWSIDFTPGDGSPTSPVNRFRAPPDPVGKLLDRFIIALLAFNIVLMVVEKETAEKGSAPFSPSVTTADGTASDGEKAPTLSGKSVAVLPFAVMSNGPDDTYFTDGFTEEIIDVLSQLPDLMVTARTSTFYFRDPIRSTAEIARQLAVANLVEGSVSRAGNQLRITAQLVRAADGFQLWSDTWDGHTEDTFAVLQEIAEKVAAALEVVPTRSEREKMQRVGLRNADAIIAYQKGQELFTKAHLEQVDFSLLRQANLQFEAVIALAPDYSRAYLQHADLYTHILASLASGQLDGNITPSDFEYAPSELRFDFDEAESNALDENQRLIAASDRALLAGEWNGLATRSQRALSASTCQGDNWAHLATAAFGAAKALRDAYGRRLACNPLETRAGLREAQAYLWLGQPALAQHSAVIALQKPGQELQSDDHHFLIWTEAMALGEQGDFAGARQSVATGALTEEDRSFLHSLLASMQGESERAGDYLHDFLSQHGPDDQSSLILEAARGNRTEANRLAGLMDGRTYGYVALLQAIYLCACGEPFDLEAAPVFAGMLKESGLSWPPGKPLNFPLKGW